ncbi:MAG: PHP domain-containing protein, partial [Oligoflexia bacterium]|nr:PHP domain-containing protein [Oligoflexia bacterium]
MSLDYKTIKFINLHAHSQYSLLDGVGSVKDHFIETIEKGHCGCAMTDHGNYTSFIDLYNLEDNKKGDKRVNEVFKKNGIESHPTVKGCELYIYDDSAKISLLEMIYTSKTLSELIDKSYEFVEKLSLNPRYGTIFNHKHKATDIEVVEKITKKSDHVGSKCLKLFEEIKNSNSLDEAKDFNKLKELLEKLAHATTRCQSYKYNHITVMAKNKIGHKNLSHLSTEAHLGDNFYLRPRIPLSRLLELKEGLIVTSGCFIGMIPQALFNDNIDQARKYVKLFQKEFGDDFYIELHVSAITHEYDRSTKSFLKQPFDSQRVVNTKLLKLIEELGLEENTYFTQDSHMPKKEDKIKQDLIIKSDSKNDSGWHFYETYYIMSIKEMHEKVKKNLPEVSDEEFVKYCENSVKVLEKCQEFKIDTSLKMMTPDYKNHPIKNSIVLDESKLLAYKFYNEANKLEKYVLRDKVRKSLSDDRSYIESVDLSILKSFIDPKASTQREISLAKLEEKLKGLKAQYSEETLSHIVDLAFDERFPQLSESLNALLLVALDNNKIDLSRDDYRKRFFDELMTIQSNGVAPFSDYFMCFEEFVRVISYMQEMKGPGRGSAAGCIVSYALDVTDIDPIKRKLPFWRFLIRERLGIIFTQIEGTDELYRQAKTAKYSQKLNAFESIYSKLSELGLLSDPQIKTELTYLRCNLEDALYFELLSKKKESLNNEHNWKVLELLNICGPTSGPINMSERSAPDIDFDSSCRDMLIEYLVLSKGEDRVALIGSYGSLKVKSAIKVVLRVESNLSAQDQNRVTALYDRVKFSEEEMSRGEKWLFNSAIEQIDEFAQFWNDHPRLKELTLSVLESYNLNGIHACGVIVSNEPIFHSIPCWFDKSKQTYITYLDKDQVEDMGETKLDLLGLSTLEEIRDCARLIKKRGGPDYFKKGALESIIDNASTKDFKTLQDHGDTLSIFQCNTPVQTQTYRELRVVDSIEDMSAINAICRPGPMGANMHHLFVDLKNGDKKVEYLHDSLEPFLKDTLGIITYQEQVMEISQVIGGFNAFESDKLRKAMGKKKFKIIEKYEEQFLNYIEKNNTMPKAKAKKLWSLMVKFAEYSFNRAHAFCYASLGFICVHMRENHSLEWACSIFDRTARKGTAKSKESFKHFYRRWSNLIKTPDINFSKDSYVIESGNLFMPLRSIDGIRDISLKISEHGPYESFDHFVLKMRSLGEEKVQVIESLILAGACDSFYNAEQGSYEVISYLNDDFDNTEVQNSMLKDMLGLENDNKNENVNKIHCESITDFRKSLLMRYANNLRHVKIIKKASDALKEEGLYNPNNLYELYLDPLNYSHVHSPEVKNTLNSLNKCPVKLNVTTKGERE